MEKIDFLTSKVNEILYELNYLKDDLAKAKSNLSAIQTENFLLNSNFIINQKGKELYENTSGLDSTETADKWILNGVGSYKDKGRVTLKPGSYFAQTLTLENGLKSLLFKEATLTLYIADYYGSGHVFGVKMWTDETNYIQTIKEGIKLIENSVTFTVPEECVKLEVFMENQSTSNVEVYAKLSWMKLEIGNKFTNYVSPCYDVELLKCNRQNIEFCETLYDMSSEDSQVNLGYTSGIKGGVTITKLDFSKYKKIKIYSVINWDYSVTTVSLEKIMSEYGYYSGTDGSPRVINSNSMYTYGTFVTVKPSKKEISISYFRNSTYYNSNVNYFCYKIEGIY